jgi:hypothetical protein
MVIGIPSLVFCLTATRLKTLTHWRQNEKAEKPACGLLSAGSDAPALQNFLVSQNLFQGFLLT